MAFDYYDMDTKVPDVGIDRLREDFQLVFERNAVDVLLIKTRKDLDVQEGADLYETRTPMRLYKKLIKMFINAGTTNAYRWREQGIVTNDSMFHAFAEHNADIDNDDVIQFVRTTNIAGYQVDRGTQFRVSTHNEPFYKGQFAWQEFDLKRIDKENIYREDKY